MRTIRKRHLASAGLLLAVAACARPSAARRAPGPAPQYAGVTLERSAELPAPAPAGTGPVSVGVPGVGVPVVDGPAAAFARACAMRLRDPRDGRELLLVRSMIAAAPDAAAGGATVTRLERATGDYALLTADGRAREAPPYLRVDCTSGRAAGWVAPGS